MVTNHYAITTYIATAADIIVTGYTTAAVAADTLIVQCS